MFGHVWRIAEWIVWINVCTLPVFGQDLIDMVEVGNSQYLIYTGSKTFDEAQTYCEGMSGNLAKTNSRLVIDALPEDKLSSYTDFWIGATDNDEEGTWKWLDGTLLAVDNWPWGQPDNWYNEDCMTMRSNKNWNDRGCSDKTNFICERIPEGVKKVTVPKSEFTLGLGNKFSIYCFANAYPMPSVAWYFGDGEVDERSIGRNVYQTKRGSYSSLNLENATLSDQGNYTCQATNTVGNQNYTAAGVSKIIVPSTPNITSISSNPCNSSLVITWFPNKRANDITHRMALSKDFEEILSVTIERSNGELTYTTPSLKDSSHYNVTVTPCPSECMYEYTVTKAAFTGGLPNAVKNANFTKIEGVNAECLIRWDPPEVTLNNYIFGHQITVEQEISEVAEGFAEPSIPAETMHTGSELEFNFTRLLPNRQFSFKVQAQTCAGLGPTSKAVGSCASSKKEPNSVAEPVVTGEMQNDGTATITTALPDQSNGPISCLFVVVGEERNVTAGSINGIQELMRANASAADSIDRYIAIALPPTRFENSKREITLGNNEESSCNVYTISSRKRRSVENNGTVVGVNLMLQKDKAYSIYVVSTTPSRGNILIKSSGGQRLQSYHEEAQLAGSEVIVGATVAAFLIVASILIFVLIRRRRRQSPNEHVKSAGLADGNGIVSQNRMEEIIYQNTEFVEDRRPETEVQMKDFERVYNDMLLNDGARFIDQFQFLVQESANRMGATSIASNPNFKKKNRYKNVLPYDSTRVILESSNTGYINANYIDGFERNKKFIATQGPLPGTMDEFWLMVLEQRCLTIVMLAKCMEAGKKKCAKYWPDSGSSENFGSVVVTNREEIKFCGFVRRRLEISAVVQGEEIRRTISQYHMLNWPDHGVPITTSLLIRMHKEAIVPQTSHYQDAPIIVHCSAGAGRTGTLIAYDILFHQSERTKLADVYSCVLRMREQRVDMVQNCDQYVLVHKLLLESFSFGDTDLKSSEAAIKFESREYKSNVAMEQFNNLSRVEPVLFSARNAGQSVSPYERMKITIMKAEKDHHHPTIDASYIESYDESNRMIAAKSPSEEKLEYFFRSILHENVTVIVQIDDKMEYIPANVGESLQYGDLSVTLQDISKGDLLEETIFSLSGFGSKITVTHLKLMMQGSDLNSKDIKKVIKVIEEMQKLMRKSKASTALIHCRDGIGSTGTFCAAVNLIERLKVENNVDVFRAVKDLRDCRPGMVPNLDHYILCHLAVTEYFNSLEIYSNFR